MNLQYLAITEFFRPPRLAPPLHHDYSTTRDTVTTGYANKLRCRREGPRDDGVVSLPRLVVFHASVLNGNRRQPQLGADLDQKSGALGAGVQQHDTTLRQRYGQRNSGQSRPAAHIENTFAPYVRKHGEAVQNMAWHTFRRIGNRRQIENPVPAFQQVQITLQLGGGAVGQLHAELPAPGDNALLHARTSRRFGHAESDE